MNKFKCPYIPIFGGCPAECPSRWHCLDYDGDDIVIIDRYDRSGDYSEIHAQRTARFDFFRVYNSEGFFLWEIIRYRCSGNYYIRTIFCPNWTPVLMSDLYPGWRITEVFDNG